MRIGIIGAGGHGKVIADAVLADGRDQIFGFFDNDQSLWGRKLLGIPIIGPVDHWSKHSTDAFLIGIGDNRERKRLFDQLKSAGATIATITHPRATVGGEEYRLARALSCLRTSSSILIRGSVPTAFSIPRARSIMTVVSEHMLSLRQGSILPARFRLEKVPLSLLVQRLFRGLRSATGP